MSELTESSLPVLNDAELRAIFRDDERAIWRYHILSALLHDHRAVSDVARAYDTAVETVRTLRATFLASGALDDLRSRRRGAVGHLGRQTPLAQAVARELATAPDATSNAIWLRVSKQLEGTGIAAPRRTTYRLIERLRPQAEQAAVMPTQDALWPPALVPALRVALPLLPNDPPFDLGRSELALHLLSSESDVLERGRQLKGLLSQALHELGPGSDDDPHDARFRPYQILVGEALHEYTREQLQDELAVAPATYTRAKRQGLERIAEWLVYRRREQQRAAIRALPPVVPPLFGRDRELRYYTQRLATEGLSIVWGLPGSGKTVLAGTLAAQARQAGAEVIWHRCTGAGDEIVQALLQSYGEEPHVLSQALPGLLATLRTALRRGGLLVLEQYERIANDPATDVLLAMIRASIEPNHVQVIMCSRALPLWARDNGWLPLGGLPDDLARPLWSSFGGATFEAQEWATVVQKTMGYPRLLQMLAADPAAPLAAAIWEQVCETLSPAARNLLSELLLAGTPHVVDVARDFPSGVGGGLGPTPLQELALHGLITFQPGRDAVFVQVLLLAHRAEILAQIRDQAAIYQRLIRHAKARQLWHFAASYAVAAGEHCTALTLIETYIDHVVQQGQGEATALLLRRITGQLAPGAELARALGVLGRLLMGLGREREAAAALTTALDLARLYEPQLTPALVRHWERLLAETQLRRGEWRQALAFAQASMGGGRAIDVDVSAEERLSLTLLQHRIWLMAGQVSQARRWLADAQMQVQIAPDAYGEALVWLAEGIEAARRGDMQLAPTRLQRALDGLRDTPGYTERFSAAAALARCFTALGEWEQAHTLVQEYVQVALTIGHHSGVVELMLADADQALTQARPIDATTALTIAMPFLDESNRLLHAQLQLIRGRLAMQETALADGWQHFQTVIALADDPATDEWSATANVYLALLTLQRGDATTGAQYARRVVRQAEMAGLERHRSIAYLCLAQEAMLRRSLDEAAAALDAIPDAPADPVILAHCRRLRAALLMARGFQDEARRLFAESEVGLQRSPIPIQQWVGQNRSGVAHSE